MKLTRKLFAPAAAALLLAGCASARSPSESPSVDPAEEPELVEALRELSRSKAELSASRGLGECAEVCRLSSLICQAGGRICSLAHRHGQAQPYAAHCLSARADCRGAQEQCEDCK